MAYVSGSAASFADLKSAIETACTSNGWSLTSGVLSYGATAYFKLTNDTTNLRLDGGTGQSGSSLTGAYTYGVKFANIASTMSFPINYEIHLFENPAEVYIVINYNSDFYQQMSFGISAMPGIGGTGAWFTGMFDSRLNDATATVSKMYITANLSQIGTQAFNGPGFGLFSSFGGTYHTSFLHCGLDSTVGWRTLAVQTVGTGMYPASVHVAGILSGLPTLATQSTVLLPIGPSVTRNSNGRTLGVRLENARLCRIDNIVPGDIVTYGAEQWVVYPWYRKDSTTRDGVPWVTGAEHSGTFGFAVRYTGV